MSNPLHAIGYRFLSTTLQAEKPGPGHRLSLSRRGFLLLAATMASCRAAAPLADTPPGTKSHKKKKSAASTADYSVPAVQGPVPRNPDMSLDSHFSSTAGISFSRVLVSGNYVAMTFDDGPHPQNTPRLLEILRARNIKATFFVIGQSVNLYPSVVRSTVAEGHEIGNHSNTHRLLSKLSDAEICADLTRCRDAVTRAADYQMHVMRPPYGGLVKRQREMVHSEFGYPTILWSVDPLDWKRPGPSVVASRIVKGTNAGSIILSHDLHGQTVDAMPATLDNLLSRGFKFVTVSQLIAMKSTPGAADPAASPAKS